MLERISNEGGYKGRYRYQGGTYYYDGVNWWTGAGSDRDKKPTKAPYQYEAEGEVSEARSFTARIVPLRGGLQPFEANVIVMQE
jgi:hypothetical protein